MAILERIARSWRFLSDIARSHGADEYIPSDRSDAPFSCFADITLGANEAKVVPAVGGLRQQRIP